MITADWLLKWCAAAASGERVVYGVLERTPRDVMLTARALSEAHLVRLFQQRKDHTFARVAVRTSDAVREMPLAELVPLALPNERCPVPGCERTLGATNTSGVCADHKHQKPFCQCPACSRTSDVPSWETCAANGMTLTEASKVRGNSAAAGAHYARRKGLTFAKKGHVE